MKNRITDYEAGWLTLLIKMGIADEAQAREAMNRVAQAAVQELPGHYAQVQLVEVV